MRDAPVLPRDILPHGAGMLLIDGPGENDGEWLVFQINLSDRLSVVDSLGEAPAEVGLEMMAQACGMLVSSAANRETSTRRIGVVGAVRGYEYSLKPFRVGEDIRVRVRAAMVEDSLVVCEGELYRGAISESQSATQRARITLILTEDSVT